MRNLILTLMMLVLFSAFVFPQGLRILGADSLSNGTTHTFEMNLERVGTIDSIVVSVYCVGEINIDTIYVHGGFKAPDISYADTVADIDGGYELIEGATTTIDLADGIEEIVQKFITLTASELLGYNNLKFYVVGASGGCDEDDDYQKYILYVEVFQPIRYNKQLY